MRHNERLTALNIGILLIYLILNSCDNNKKRKFHFLKPNYNKIKIIGTRDTLRFEFDSSFYNNIRSFNYFVDENTGFMSLYDKQSRSVNIYNFSNSKLVQKINLKQYLPGRDLSKKTSVYVKNLKEIYVVNNMHLYRLGILTYQKDSIELLQSPIYATSGFVNSNPPYFKNNHLYITSDPLLARNSLSKLRKWKVLYDFDLNKRTAKLVYGLPDIYMRGFENEKFFKNSYCYNDKGKLMFSFALDTLLHETDLNLTEGSYFAKSRYDLSTMNFRSNKNRINNDSSYLLSFSYGPVYYDAHEKRYLRVALHSLNETEYRAGNRNKRQSLLILDDKLAIIGESIIDNILDMNSIIITKEGEIYCRIKSKDEYAIYFTKLKYQNNQNVSYAPHNNNPSNVSKLIVMSKQEESRY
jgi:hypothetical protein